MQSYGVTSKMKPVEQYFHMVLFITFINRFYFLKSVDTILCRCGLGFANQLKPFQLYFHLVIRKPKFWDFFH